MKTAIGNRQSAVGGCHDDRVVSRLAGLAGSHGPCRGLLSANRSISSRRDVRHDGTNSPSCSVRSGEYRRGIWARQQRRLRAVPACGARLAQRDGDAFAAGSAPWTCTASRGRATSLIMRWSGADAPVAHSVHRTQYQAGVRPTADCRLPTAVSFFGAADRHV